MCAPIYNRLMHCVYVRNDFDTNMYFFYSSGNDSMKSENDSYKMQKK